MMEKEKYIKDAFAMLEKINSAVTREYDSLLNHDLTPKQILLLRAVRDEERVLVSRLSDILAFSPSSLSQMIKRLETGQFLKRDINPENRREVFVSLGGEAEQLFLEYEKIDNDIIEKYYADFTLDEVKVFKSLVEKLFHAVGEGKQ